MKTKDILKGKLCPYCNKKTKLINSSFIYAGRDFGNLWYCDNCHNYVGCHKGSSHALGRVANKELRKLKEKAHSIFDVLWKRKKRIEGISKTRARKEGYKWLSNQLKIPHRYCHIAMFNKRQCIEVILLCSKYVN